MDLKFSTHVHKADILPSESLTSKRLRLESRSGQKKKIRNKSHQKCDR